MGETFRDSLGRLRSRGSVVLEDGSAVGLVAGASVALADGTEVDLVDGAVVDLAEGATVALADGSEVGLVEGSAVTLKGSTGEELEVNADGSVNVIGTVGGRTVTVGVEFTRPADEDPYAALDAVSNSTSEPTIITFANVVPANGGSGYITKVRCFTDKAAAMAPRFRVHVYNEAVAAVNDNAAFPLLFANAAKRVAAIDLSAFRSEGAGSDASAAQNISDRVAFACASASRSLFALVETLDAFTPASGQKFYLELSVEAN